MKIKDILISAAKGWRIWGVISTCVLLAISISIGWTTRIGGFILALGVIVGIATFLFLSEE